MIVYYISIFAIFLFTIFLFVAFISKKYIFNLKGVIEYRDSERSLRDSETQNILGAEDHVTLNL